MVTGALLESRGFGLRTRSIAQWLPEVVKLWDVSTTWRPAEVKSAVPVGPVVPSLHIQMYVTVTGPPDTVIVALKPTFNGHALAGGWVPFSVALAVPAGTVTWHVCWRPEPAQAPPQLSSCAVPIGCAVSTTEVPAWNTAEHRGGQEMPLGWLVIVPFPVALTVSVPVCDDPVIWIAMDAIAAGQPGKLARTLT